MNALTYVAVIVIVVFSQNSSASRISFQVVPNNIYPVLTKLVALRCAVQEDTDQTNRTIRNRELVAEYLRALDVNILTTSNQTHAATNPTHPTTTNPTHPTTTNPTHPTNTNTTHTAGTNSAHPGSAGSTHPTAATSAHTSTSKNPPAVSHADVSHIMSIIISKHDKATGKLQTVAKLSPYDSPNSTIDQDVIKVEGDTDSSPVAREKGYLEVSWEYPSEAQSGDYICDVYALDSTLHPVSLSSSVGITASHPTISDLAGFVAQNERHINELKKSMSDLTSQISILKQQNQAQIETIHNVTDTLLNRTENIKAQNIQTGTVTCTNSFVTFLKPFSEIPTVFISVFDYQVASIPLSFDVAINNLTNTGFTPVCTKSRVTNSNIMWIAIDH